MHKEITCWDPPPVAHRPWLLVLTFWFLLYLPLAIMNHKEYWKYNHQEEFGLTVEILACASNRLGHKRNYGMWSRKAIWRRFAKQKMKSSGFHLSRHPRNFYDRVTGHIATSKVLSISPVKRALASLTHLSFCEFAMQPQNDASDMRHGKPMIFDGKNELHTCRSFT